MRVERVTCPIEHPHQANEPLIAAIVLLVTLALGGLQVASVVL